MRAPKPVWVRQVKALCGSEADLRWNEPAGRWEFLLPCADHVLRSQFWGWFTQPVDPLTGLHPYRDLDDAGMQEALRNLQQTFVGNPYDGAGSPRREVRRRMEYNRQLKLKKYQQGAEGFADYVAEHRRRFGSLLLPMGASIDPTTKQIVRA